MTTLHSDDSMQECRRLTDQDIADTYEQLGLNDPEVREFYKSLRDLAPKQESPVWLRTSYHSSAPKE